MKGRQSQKAGDNSANIQGENVAVFTGVTYQDVRHIIADVLEQIVGSGFGADALAPSQSTVPSAPSGSSRAGSIGANVAKLSAEQKYQIGIQLFRRNYNRDAIDYLLSAEPGLRAPEDRCQSLLCVSRSAAIIGENDLALRSALRVVDERRYRIACDLDAACWALVRRGDALRNLGSPSSAMADYSRARALLKGKGGHDRICSVVLERIGDVLCRETGTLAEAHELYAEDIGLREMIFEPSKPQSIRDLVAARQRQANALVRSDQLDEALLSLTQTGAIAADLASSDATNPGWQCDLAKCLHKRAETHLLLNDIDQAEFYFGAAYEAASLGYHLDPQNPRFRDTMSLCRYSWATARKRRTTSAHVTFGDAI